MADVERTHEGSGRYDWVTAMREAGISRTEMAARTCVSENYVYRMETGSRRPTPAWLAVAWRVIANGPWPKEGGC